MTPAEEAVIAAAEAFVGDQGSRREELAMAELFAAVAAMNVERAAEPEHPHLPWERVVTGDEIYSVKHERWYRVRATERLDLIKSSPAKVRVTMDGAPSVTVPADATVQVRRSPMGNAVDAWGSLNPEVISS